MNTNQIDNQVFIKSEAVEGFEFENNMSKEDPIINQDHRSHDHQITQRFNGYLRKDYCMTNRACQICNCMLLRTRRHKLFCRGCKKINAKQKNIRNKKQVVTKYMKKCGTQRSKKHRTQRSKKHMQEKEHVENVKDCNQLENKIKWAVNKVI
ncbi:unnamed protein product [Rotaria sp. Silwood2]|nr:unnamed protein product [Rotaria sp. Silwood2]CAF4722356.1 unnamed protein product [Rotaria sp. Silwood2]